MAKEDSEDDIYDDSGIEEALEEEEIDDLEEGFMRGYEEEGIPICPICKKIIDDFDDITEVEYEGKSISFCSERCSIKFKKRHKL